MIGHLYYQCDRGLPRLFNQIIRVVEIPSLPGVGTGTDCKGTKAKQTSIARGCDSIYRGPTISDTDYPYSCARTSDTLDLICSARAPHYSVTAVTSPIDFRGPSKDESLLPLLLRYGFSRSEACTITEWLLHLLMTQKRFCRIGSFTISLQIAFCRMLSCFYGLPVWLVRKVRQYRLSSVFLYRIRLC
ncbi:hypothetical protein BD769DRAFT_787009 [Suillus cothurnatus]|nr:hypothetical protein BD769DRAFT_787009 [Suillus cothurnatus]